MMQDFPNEALQSLSQASPELANYIIRFQDLSSKLPEDSNVSMGVILLQLPPGFYLVPVIARGEIVYPLDSLYDMSTDMFLPLTTDTVTQLIRSQGTRMGKPTRIPSYVNINPSVYNLIVPPRTGKYSYASGQLEEFLATLPPHLWDRLYNTMLDNKDMAKQISRYVDLQSIAESRVIPSSPQSKPLTTTVSKPSVEVITGTTGLSNLDPLVIKDIVDCGYHIRGDVIEPRQAVEQVTGAEGYLQLQGAIQGMAYKAVLADGSHVNGMVLKRAPRREGIDMPDHKLRPHAGFFTTEGVAGKEARGNLFISEYGGWTDDGMTVLVNTPVLLSDVAQELYTQGRVRDLNSVVTGDTFVILTGKGALGPFTACTVTHTDFAVVMDLEEPWDYGFYRGMADRCGRLKLTASTGFKGDYFVDSGEIITNPVRSVVVLPNCIADSVERNINSAQRKLELRTIGMLQDPVEIRSHGHGMFSFNGSPISEVDLVKKLIIGEGIGKQACLTFIKSAQDKGSITVFMAKKASDMGATPVGEIPEYGQMPPQEEPTLFDTNAVQGAIDTGYPDIVESTIISQILLDPSMYSTISTYLPAIDRCLDRIGRTLLFLRLGADESAPDNLPTLISALRGTYRSLGDSALKLKNALNAAISRDADTSRSRI